MNIKRIAPFALATFVAVGASGGIAHAENQDRNQDKQDVAALADMKVTLQQAITTAEQHTGGRAVGADLSQEPEGTRIAVEIAGQQGVKTVLIDAQTGQMTENDDGRENGEGSEDHENGEDND